MCNDSSRQPHGVGDRGGAKGWHPEYHQGTQLSAMRPRWSEKVSSVRKGDWHTLSLLHVCSRQVWVYGRWSVASCKYYSGLSEEGGLGWHGGYSFHTPLACAGAYSVPHHPCINVSLDASMADGSVTLSNAAMNSWDHFMAHTHCGMHQARSVAKLPTLSQLGLRAPWNDSASHERLTLWTTIQGIMWYAANHQVY